MTGFKMALAAELFAVIDRKRVYVAVECTLRFDEVTLLEPDIMVCAQASVRRSPEGYVEVRGEDIMLLVEIADSSLHYDRRRKAAVYATHGLADYWIADLSVPQFIVHRAPGTTGYGDVRRVAAGTMASPLNPALSAFAPRLADFM